MVVQAAERKPLNILVVGGGLAGLTAAKTLVDQGHQVKVLEGREVFGGKASSWRDADGDWIESGLHVFFGAYVEIFDLMRELGIYDNILWKEHVLTYTMAGGERFAFRTWDLPSPLHLFPAIFGNTYFSMAEKLTLARMLVTVFKGENYFKAQDTLTYEEWHLKHGISKRMLSRMFLPMALALKFVPPPEISAKIVLDVSNLFLQRNGASRMGFLNGSPQDKLIGPLVDYLRRRGATLRAGLKVRGLLQDGPRSISGVWLETREEVYADAVLLALPIHQLNRLIPNSWREESYFEGLSHFEGVPVMTVQLWLDRQVTGINNILFCSDGQIPVYADPGNTTPDYRFGGRSRIESVVAPARDLMDQDDAAVVGRVWSDIQAAFPATAPGAKMLKSTVVRIPQSVYWPRPGLGALRPTQRTPVERLYLAGGYTIQRFYDSMEGAVSSGRLAARAVLEDAPKLSKPAGPALAEIKERLT